MMVDDDDVAFGGATAHLGDEAAVVLRALLADATFGSRVELGPKLARFRQHAKFGAVAVLRFFLPVGNGAVLVDLVKTIQHGLVGELVQLFAAKIIVAPLHVADAQGADSSRIDGGGAFRRKQAL